MSAISQLDSDFAFVGAAEPDAARRQPGIRSARSPSFRALGTTPGTWVGHGFNAIWRPHQLAPGTIGSSS